LIASCRAQKSHASVALDARVRSHLSPSAHAASPRKPAREAAAAQGRQSAPGLARVVVRRAAVNGRDALRREGEAVLDLHRIVPAAEPGLFHTRLTL